MSEVLGVDLGVNLPSFATSGLGLTIIIICMVVLFLFVIGLIAYLYVMNKVYNIKIRDFENIAGQGFQLVHKDTARLLKVGDGGEEIMFLRKKKQYRTAYGKKMGKREYWFAQGQDGYFYNFVLGDLDAKRGMLDIDPVDRDLRYAHASIRDLVKDRAKSRKVNVTTAIVVGGLVLIVLIMVIGGYYIAAKQVEAAKLTSQNVESLKPVADAMQKVAAHLDSLYSGSGIRSAG